MVEEENNNTFLTGTEEVTKIIEPKSGLNINLADALHLENANNETVPIDAEQLKNRSLKKNESAFYKSLNLKPKGNRFGADGSYHRPKVGIFRSSGIHSNTSFSNTIFNPRTKFYDKLHAETGNKKKFEALDTKLLSKKYATTNSSSNFFTHTNPFGMAKTESGRSYTTNNLKGHRKENSSIYKISTEAPDTMPRYFMHSHYKNDSPFSSKFRVTSNLYNTQSKSQTENKLFLTTNLCTPSADDPGNNLFQGVDIADDVSEQDIINSAMEESLSDDSVNPIDNDKEEKKMVGLSAVSDYYRHNKQVDKVMDQNKYQDQGSSVYTGMLQKTSQNFLLPNKLGIIKAHGDKKLLNCRNFMIGNKYAKVLSEGINRVDFDSLDLANNRLDERGAKTVLKKIRPSNKSLNLSQNRIGKSVQLLEPVLLHKDSRLQVLDLSMNNLGNHSTISLLSKLQQNKFLEILNLSENSQTDNICHSMAELITYHPKQKELYLRWNSISYVGGRAIFKSLAKGNNNTQKVLDLSWNILGNGLSTGKDSSCTDEICDFITSNESILHLDLSNNAFNTKQSDHIAKALKKNHSIFGFHFTGNKGYVNSEDYLIVDENDDLGMVDVFSSHVQKKIDGCKPIKSNCLNMIDNIRNLKNSCWICDNWMEQEFEWTGLKQECDFSSCESEEDLIAMADINPTFIHFKHENYKPILMKPNDNHQIQCKMMCPNTRLFFFFTYNNMAEISEDYTVINLEKPEFCNFLIGEAPFCNIMTRQNMFEFKSPQGPIIDDEYNITVNTRPRVRREVYTVSKIVEKQTRPKWKFSKSIFKHWKFETEEVTLKCFEEDWAKGKMTSFIKDEEDRNNLKEYLRTIYYLMKECYKYNSSQCSIVNLWGLSLNNMTELIIEMKVVDNIYMKLADLDIEFKKVNYTQEKFKVDSHIYIVRYEFLEMMIRVSALYFLRNKKAATYTESAKLFIETFAMPCFSKYDSKPFRRKLYWKEENDYFYKSHKLILDNIWTKYSGLKTLPGNKKFMSLEEYRNLIIDCGCNKMLKERDINLCYVLSFETQVNELTTTRIFEMSYIEFLEGVARQADRISLPSLYYKEEDEIKNLTDQEREKQPLCLKIEALLVKMMHTVVPHNTIRKYTIPADSVFTRNGKIMEYEEWGVDE